MSDTMDTEFVRLDVADHAAVVTMDRPPVNAVNAEFHDELMRVFDTLSDRDDVRVAVLTGAGRVFCAGADIKGRAGREPQPGDFWQASRRAREAFHSILECRVPVIAAINGPALGAGLAIVASCDLLIASEHGRPCRRSWRSARRSSRSGERAAAHHRGGGRGARRVQRDDLAHDPDAANSPPCASEAAASCRDPRCVIHRAQVANEARRHPSRSSDPLG